MAQLTQTQFSKYSLTQQEEVAGSLLINDQKVFIQNQIGAIAEQILVLVPDPTNYAAFIQQHAYLQGQLVAYQYLLDCSFASEAILLEEAQNRQT